MYMHRHKVLSFPNIPVSLYSLEPPGADAFDTTGVVEHTSPLRAQDATIPGHIHVCSLDPAADIPRALAPTQLAYGICLVELTPDMAPRGLFLVLVGVRPLTSAYPCPHRLH
jgi:hypothetical protein